MYALCTRLLLFADSTSSVQNLELILSAGSFGSPTNWDQLPVLLETAIYIEGICGVVPGTDALCVVRRMEKSRCVGRADDVGLTLCDCCVSSHHPSNC